MLIETAVVYASCNIIKLSDPADLSLSYLATAFHDGGGHLTCSRPTTRSIHAALDSPMSPSSIIHVGIPEAWYPVPPLLLRPREWETAVLGEAQPVPA
jgi:hypothetical protein